MADLASVSLHVLQKCLQSKRVAAFPKRVNRDARTSALVHSPNGGLLDTTFISYRRDTTLHTRKLQRRAVTSLGTPVAPL